MTRQMVRLHRRHAMAIAMAILVGVGFIAPESPLVGSVAASGICAGSVAGGRVDNTTLWGDGAVTCSGDVTDINLYLRVEHCDFDILGACLHWSFVKTFKTRAAYGPGYWAIPISGVAKAYNLLNDHIYHVNLHIDHGTICCGWQHGDGYSQQFRL